MSILYLTTVALDIIGGAVIWSATKTYNGVYYLLYGNEKQITDEKICIDKDMLEELVKDNKDYRDKIEKLNTNILDLKECVNNLKK
tara:strand:+ start:319 stop:576 length:258 start_codon:yes stop_codon:yes gene_type:complete